MCLFCKQKEIRCYYRNKGNQPIAIMLRAPVLMRNLRKGKQTIQKNVKKLSSTDHKGSPGPTRPTFRSVCGLATELNVQITIKEHNSINSEVVFYKYDEDRFRQR